MPSDVTRLFISYSHQDREWLDRLRVHLKPLETNFKIDIWEDTRIKPGSKWKQEIEKAIKACKVAVLLISADFLASDFITTNELPRLLSAAEETGATILILILSPSRFTKTAGLSEFQTVNHPSKPLISMTRGDQEAVFLSASEHVEAVLTSSQHIGAQGSPAGGLQKGEPIGNTPRKNRTADAKIEHNNSVRTLEATVSNPNYDFDLKALEGRWELDRVVSLKTIIIVTGSHLFCELLDRPVAEVLRDEIDRRGDVPSGSRGIIVGDTWWFHETALHSHHAISIGGPSINKLTLEITKKGITSPYSADLYTASLPGDLVRVAIWGTLARQTKTSAESYIRRPDGLQHLLDTCWSL